MRRFVNLFLLLPLALVIVTLSVANRGAVTFSLDPFGTPLPALSITAPLFILLFIALALGIVIGGVAAWVRQGKWRRLARSERANAERLRQEAERLRAQIAAARPALPGPSAERDAA
jgi:hypothetical protein